MNKKSILTFVLAAVMVLASATAFAAGDAKKGKKVFNKCKACHTANKGGKNRVGPNLFGVVGRAIGGAPKKYRYSKSYKAAGKKGLTWDEASIDEYLKDPKKYMRKITGNKRAKSKMVFKLKKAKQRADVIAFLKSNM